MSTSAFHSDAGGLSGSKTLGVRAPADDEQALEDRLARELANRWQHGDTILVEELFEQHPEIRDNAQAALRLIYEEVCLRQEAGEADAVTKVRARFPSFATELELLLDCQRLVVPEPVWPLTATAGQTVGDYHLLAEIGRGGQGKVFLARQPTLADRPVVVKLSPCAGQEHLNLARLQHTHIVPLYAAQENSTHNLRILCMPYLGGASLARILQALRPRCSDRVGRDVLLTLDRLQAMLPLAVPTRGKVRSWMAGASYEQVICWIGSCLADALQYAHERGLVHFDLTAANVLLTAEGLPMLLDFHLAREPIQPGASGPQWLGGTPGYAAPEQARAFLALQQGRPLPNGVDQRADVYSLGMVLYQALGGPVVPELTATPSHKPLRCHNPSVSIGLADVVDRCVSLRREDRYQSAGELTEDLRRQLAGLPLRGVPNRSLIERWRKWRRRRPSALALSCALLALLAAGVIGLDYLRRQGNEAQAALQRGQELLAAGQYAQAQKELHSGRGLAANLLFPRDLFGAFDRSMQEAEKGLLQQQREQAVSRLHIVVEQLRLLAPDESLPEQQVHSLEGTCRELWATRNRLLEIVPPGQSAGLNNDLLDLAIIWADLKARPAGWGPGASVRRQEALQILAEAEKLAPGSPALQWEQRRHQQTVGWTSEGIASTSGLPAWDHLVVGRSLLRAGKFAEARAELGKAIEAEPNHFWAHYYKGVASFRGGRAEEAVSAFNVCLALSPRSSACYHNRGLAQAALGATEQAVRDYTRALDLEPTLAAAAFNRGVLHAKNKHYREALRDFHHALEHGADRATVMLALGQVQQALSKER